MSAQQRPVLSVVLVNLEGFFCAHDNCLILEASRGEAATVSVSTFAGSPFLSLNPHLAPRVEIWNSEFESISHIFDSLQEITPNKSTKAMQGIWLPTDLQWIRHSCSIWGGWVKRTKGLQRFSMLSFLAKAWDVKLLLFLLRSFILALAMHHIELTRAEPLAFFCSHENACTEKQLFFLLAQISTYCHQHRVQERFTSILGRTAAERCWERRSRARLKVTPVWGYWAGGLAGGWAIVALGVDGVHAAGAWVLYDYEACGPGLAFQQGSAYLGCGTRMLCHLSQLCPPV